MSSEKTGPNEYTLIFKATIEDGWKVYGTDIDAGGPIPTSVNFEGVPASIDLSKPLEALGRKEVAVEPLFDNMTLSYYKKRLTLRKVVTVTKDVVLKGYVEFMTCDDKQCLPPDAIDFTFNLKADAGETLDNKITTTNGLLTPVKWKVSSEKISDTEYYIHFKATIDEGWKLYAQDIKPGGPIPTSFTFSNAKTGGYTLNGKVEEVIKPEEQKEPLFDNMLLKYFKHEAHFRQKITVNDSSATVKGSYEFMCCDATQCLPSEIKEFSVDLISGVVSEEGEETSLQVDTTALQFNIDNTPLSLCGGEAVAADEENKGFMSIFLLGFIGGLIALLTPCVFPMIPLTVSFFTKRSQNKSKGVFEAFFYGFCIVLIYALLSLPFVIYKLPPDTLNAISTSVYLNVGFFVVFMVFAFSFFGFYEITLPASWLNKADNASSVGGLVGIFFMALTLALVSFSCTGPILGSLLVGTLTAEGGQMNLLVGMIGFGVALGIPFGLFAAFPQMMNKLPKSGGWLNSVKVVLGFIEVALAFKFLSNADLVSHWGLLKREIFFAIWAVCSLGIFIYLMGWLKFPHDSPGKLKLSPVRGILAVIFLFFTGYFGYGMIKGSNPKLASGFAPPMFYSIYQQDSHCPLGLNCFHDFDEAIAFAQETGKPLMIDFTGWACVNCRKMEEHVWPEKEVYYLISSKYVLVSLYVDDKEMLPEEDQYISAFSGKKIRTVGNKWSDFQSSYFGVNSQPYYVLISPDGKMLNQPSPYEPDVSKYAEFLQCGLDAYLQQGVTAVK
ncbi:MAG: thioredoxin family protein [Bacteroidetes bacterium]|nr:thioredoxin family protein [Bacteroidota bacterium]